MFSKGLENYSLPIRYCLEEISVQLLSVLTNAIRTRLLCFTTYSYSYTFAFIHNPTLLSIGNALLNFNSFLATYFTHLQYFHYNILDLSTLLYSQHALLIYNT